MGTCGCFERGSEEGRGGVRRRWSSWEAAAAGPRLGSARPSSMYLSAVNKPTLDLFSFFFFSPNFFLFPPHLIFRQQMRKGSVPSPALQCLRRFRGKSPPSAVRPGSGGILHGLWSLEKEDDQKDFVVICFLLQGRFAILPLPAGAVFRIAEKLNRISSLNQQEPSDRTNSHVTCL